MHGASLTSFGVCGARGLGTFTRAPGGTVHSCLPRALSGTSITVVRGGIPGVCGCGPGKPKSVLVLSMLFSIFSTKPLREQAGREGWPGVQLAVPPLSSGKRMLDFCVSGSPNLLLIAPVDIDPGNSRSGGPEMWNVPPAGFVAAPTDPDTIRDPCLRGGGTPPPAAIQLASTEFLASTELRLAARGGRTRNFHGYETVRRLFADGFRRCEQRRIPSPSARRAVGRLAGLADISGCQEDQLRGAVMKWEKVHTQTSFSLLTSADAFIIWEPRAGLPQQEYAPAEPAPAVTPSAGGARPHLPPARVPVPCPSVAAPPEMAS